MADNTSIVLIPTYCERRNVRDLVERIADASPATDILVIDDQSPDGTADRVRELSEQYKQLNLLIGEPKSGLGVAYGTGFRWALERGYTHLAQMDGDLSHQPEDLPRLFAALDDCDMVVGSRYVSGGAVENWESWRLWLSRSGNLYARTLLGLRFRDITSGFRAFRREVVETVFGAEIFALGYVFQIEVLAVAQAAGFSIREVPIRFSERVKGKSKIDLGIILEAIVTTPKIRARVKEAAAKRRSVQDE